MIRAGVQTDDHQYEIEFDATKYFEDAPDEAILNLAQVGWGGDYPADWVAEYLESDNSRIKEMLDYVRHPSVRNRPNAPGYEVHVNEEDALEWLKANRSRLANQIEKGMFGPREWSPIKRPKKK